MRSQFQQTVWIFVAMCALVFLPVGCEIHDTDGEPTIEFREDFEFTKSVAGRNGLFVSNVNGTITVLGIDTLTNVLISGSKIVKDQSLDEAQAHIGDIRIDIQESSSTLSVRTIQPNSSSERIYQVNYDIRIPSSWKVTLSNVNGDVDMLNIKNSVIVSVVNATIAANDIVGDISVTLTNGTISSKVFLPENGSCTFNLVNGNATLHVPRTISAMVTATVTNGSVAVSNLPIVFSTDTRTTVSGAVGAGKGTIRLSSVNGMIQVLGF